MNNQREGISLPDSRPDFMGFAKALREEAEWSAQIHANDNSGQAATDQAALKNLAGHVERTGVKLGFIDPSPQPLPDSEKGADDTCTIAIRGKQRGPEHEMGCGPLVLPPRPFKGRWERAMIAFAQLARDTVESMTRRGAECSPFPNSDLMKAALDGDLSKMEQVLSGRMK